MRILRWCGRHKVWTYFIITPLIGSFLLQIGYVPHVYMVETYLAIAILIVYVMLIWLYSGIKKLRTKRE